MSNARKTAICSFAGITPISVKISRFCKQLTKEKYSLHIMYFLIYDNISVNKI